MEKSYPNINKSELYDFYLQHKEKKYSSRELIEDLIFTRFGVSLENVSESDKNSLKMIYEVLRRSFDRFLQRIKVSKNTNEANDTPFLDLANYPALLLIIKKVSLSSHALDANVVASDEETDSSIEEEEHSDFDDAQSQNCQETKRKKFESLKSNKQRQSRCRNVLNDIIRLAEDEQVDVERLIGFIGYTYCWSKKKFRTARIYQSLWDDAVTRGDEEIPMTTAIHVKENCLIGKKNYIMMSQMLKPYVNFPSYDKISREIHLLMPTIDSFNNGVKADVLDVAKQTIARLPKPVVESLHKITTQDKNVGLVAKFSAGLDSSGGHKIYNSKAYLDKNQSMSHYTIAGICLTSIHLNDAKRTSVYAVKKVCSFSNERPLMIVPGKDEKDNIMDLVSLLNISVFKAEKEKVLIDFGSFQASFQLSITLDQMDTKTIKTLAGIPGAYCTACNTSEKDCHQPDSIQAGFPINRTVEAMNQLYSELCILDTDGTELLPKKPKDYDIRKGLCFKPISTTDVCSNITILHSYLNALKFFEQLLYCINSGVKKMKTRFNDTQLTATDRYDLKCAKKRVQEKSQCGGLYMKIDMADAAGHSGTTDTGNIARKWFSYDRRLAVLDLIENSDKGDVQNTKEMYGDLLHRFSVILRVVSSKEKQIDHLLFQKYCTESYMKILEYFEWCQIPGTIHRLLAHAAERIHLNDNFGLGSLSEESIEVSQKMLRRYRELGARKCGLKENLTDVFMHWWTQSDPSIQAEARVSQCKKCFEYYHTARYCRKASTHKTTNRFIGNEDDWIVESFFLDI